MGYVYEHTIRDAASYLLEILDKSPEAAFSTFYDGTDETAERVHKGVGIDWAPAEEGVALRALEIAIGQLENQGLLTTCPLDSKLADGESDYLISLSPKGKSWCSERFELQFHDAE